MHLPTNNVDFSARLPDVAAVIHGLVETPKHQEALIQELRQALHGSKSEKLSEDERQLVCEDLEDAMSEPETARDTTPTMQQVVRGRWPPVKRNIGNLPSHLPRIEEVIEPKTFDCLCGCGETHKIGEDRSERLNIIPGELRVIVTVRLKYTCASASDRRRSATRGAHRACSCQQICRSLALIQAISNPGPIRD